MEEQDAAAGGPGARMLRVEDGTIVMASVSVRSYLAYRKSHQLYGYLQFKTGGKTITRYIGKVTADDRSASLKLGWMLLRHRKIAEHNGWAWMTTPAKRRPRCG